MSASNQTQALVEKAPSALIRYEKPSSFGNYCLDDLRALRTLVLAKPPNCLGRVLDVVPCLEVKGFPGLRPSDDVERNLMGHLYAALTSRACYYRYSIKLIDIIVRIIMLAPPVEDKNDNMPALQLKSEKFAPRKLINLGECESKSISCKSPYWPCSVNIGTKSIRVNDCEFCEWYKDAPVDDAMAYFGAIATILLRAHVTSAREIQDAIYELVYLWPTFSHRSGPDAIFDIEDTMLEKICNLIKQDGSTFRSILKMLIANHHRRTKECPPSQLEASYFDFMVEKPFAYHGLEAFRLVDRVIMEYNLNRNSLVEWFMRCEDDSLFSQAKKYTEMKESSQIEPLEDLSNDDPSYYAAFQPYQVLFDPHLCESISLEQTKELFAVSAGVLEMRELLSLQTLKSHQYLRDLYVQGQKLGSVLRQISEESL